MTRQQFHHELDTLRDDILVMGSHVNEQLDLALKALEDLNVDYANEIYAIDRRVNEIRFDIEDRCLLLIVTQQPAARDLRLIFATTNMIIDLERMGDQTKGIAKLIPDLARHPELRHPTELKQLGVHVGDMLSNTLTAYAQEDTRLAKKTAERDDRADELFAIVFARCMQMMAEANDEEGARMIYDMIRAARELERFGDLAANVAERSIFLVTGRRPGDTSTE